MVTSDDPILKRFRAALDEMYGDRLERVVLFGSRAGDAGEDSDYDVALFLKDLEEGDLTSRRRELAVFLSQAYNLKAAPITSWGPVPACRSIAQAWDGSGGAFIEHVAALLA
jgi:predicted nucleotidyltransferase